MKYIIDTTINVRSQPNTEADILGVFHKNDSVKVKSSSVKGWGKITYRKKTAYIKLHYAHKGIKEIYLTFDDGPSHNTEKVLKILKKYNVKATFFVCGASSAETSHYLNDIGKAYRAGHAIGAHSYSHQWHIYKSTKTFYKDLDKIQAIIKKQTGKKTSLLRFPGGSGNTVSKKYAKGIMKILTRDVRKKGYQYVDWNASCGDASSKKRMKDAIVRLATASHQDQIVLLMHDSASKEETVKALPEIIETYQKRGYQFKVLNQNAFVCHADDIRN
ncbi:MAG: polysaccharide deacetylase family protein [bacterium]